MKSAKKAVTLEVADLEHLEFSGTRLADGTINCFNDYFSDWPEYLIISGVKFRQVESTDRSEERDEDAPEGSCPSQAWYVPYTPE